MKTVLFALQLVLLSSPVASWVFPGYAHIPKVAVKQLVVPQALASGSGSGDGSSFQSGSGSGSGSSPTDPVDFFTSEPTPMPTPMPEPTPMPTPMPEPTPMPSAPVITPEVDEIELEQYGDFAFLSCKGGSSQYAKTSIEVLDTQVLVGSIPKGQVDLEIDLQGIRGDVDLNLVTADGEFIVGFQADCLNSWGDSSSNCNGMEIEYSGYQGSRESIKVKGATTIDMGLYIFVYEFDQGQSSVDAVVTYSWTSTDTPCCRREELCSNSFEFDLKNGTGEVLGVFDEGVESLRLEIESEGDLDLYLTDASDPDAPKAIVQAGKGVLGGPLESSAVYKGRTYAYSGWLGESFLAPGNEWFEVEGKTNIPLQFGVTAYTTGVGTVTYFYMAPE